MTDAPTPAPVATVAPDATPVVGPASALSELLGSKKNVMALLALLCALAAHLGLRFTPDQAFMWVSPFLAAILGQGIADHGNSAELVRSRMTTYQGGLPAGAAPTPPTSSLKVVGASASLGILFLLALGASMSHGCSGAPEKIATEVGSAAGEFLSCERVDLEGYVTLNGKTLPLIAAVANDLASQNYDQLFTDLVTQLGRDAVGCATLAIADVEQAARSAPDGIAPPVTAASSPITIHALDEIQRHNLRRRPPAP